MKIHAVSNRVNSKARSHKRFQRQIFKYSICKRTNWFEEEYRIIVAQNCMQVHFQHQALHKGSYV